MPFTAYDAKALARNLLGKVGLRARRRPDALARLLKLHQIDLVLDVGANAGQFGRRIRAMGYRGRIVSFEPLARAFGKLRANARLDANWTIVNMALGDANEEREINVAGNSQSSSFLEMLPNHVAAAPKSAYVGTEKVTVRTLDSVFDQYAGGARCFLKIDVQGFEEAVLRGAAASLPRCLGLQLELSAVPVYRGTPVLCEMIGRMATMGYAVMGFEPGLCDPKTGQLLQLDGTFFRC